MMNYACDLSQSETEKYFEWIIIIILLLHFLPKKAGFMFKKGSCRLHRHGSTPGITLDSK